MNGSLAALVLCLTVVSALAVGIFAAYWTVNGILQALAHQSHPQSSGTRVLVETHASGD